MELRLQTILDAPVIELDTIDSTNNYAMRLIDADTAQPGMTVLAKQQQAGKGQRGRIWMDSHGQSVLMSVITMPNLTMEQQFLFNMSVIVAITDVLQHMDESWDVRIKWPNDIIVNDKKAGGVLIENVWRGQSWLYSVVGVGINVLQEQLDDSLIYATSLRKASGRSYPVRDLAMKLRNEMLKSIFGNVAAPDIINRYNDCLFRKGDKQQFYDDTASWSATVLEATPDGKLRVQLPDGSITAYTHGVVNWKWE